METAGLPDATEASFIPIAAVIGGLFGSTAARLRGASRDGVRRWTEDGAYLGALGGMVVYLIFLGLGV